MAHVLVTGAAGFIGLAATRALAARGDRVTAFDVAISGPLARLAEESPAVRAIAGEITEWPQLAGTFLSDKPDAVIHCAAVVGVLNATRAPRATLRVNVEGMLTLLDAMRLTGVRRMVHVSSEETYGAFLGPSIAEDHPQNPTNLYGISKLAAEQLARAHRARYGVETIHMRTSWAYGPGLPRARVPRIFLDAALAGCALHLPAGAAFAVDHTYLDDVVDGLLRALDLAEHPFDAYNLASGAAPRLDEIAAIVRELVPGAEISVGPGPYEHGSVDGITVPCPRKGALDISRARNVLGYAPRFDIRSGLADTLAKEKALADRAP